MKAVGVFPRQKKIELVDHPEPELTGVDDVAIKILDVGICGTDREIATYQYGLPPDGVEYLILGHECLGEVVETGRGTSLVKRGDLVIPTVRRPCAENCPACFAGRQDFCYTGHYAERGIVREHGFLTEFIVEREQNLNVVSRHLREAGVLAEPLTVTEKAFDQISVMAARLPWLGNERYGATALVLGAGPVGLLAAMKFRAQDYEVFVYSRGSEPGKSEIVEEIGGHFIDSEHVRPDKLKEVCGGQIDIVYEAMGAPDLVFDALLQMGHNALFVFTGIPRHANPIALDKSALLYNLVLKNQAILGTVNAAPSHFRDAVADLEIFWKLFPGVLQKLITNRFPVERFAEPIWKNDGIKNVIVFD